MAIIQLDQFKQDKQRKYMRRFRSRFDQFIQKRISFDSSGEILRLAQQHQLMSQGDSELVWDYVEMREILLDFVSNQIAVDIYEELRQQYWFDENYISQDMVAERCLCYMILGPTALAADSF